MIFSFFSSIENSYACGLMKLAAEFLIYGTRSGIVIDLWIFFIKVDEKGTFCHLKIEWLQNYSKTHDFIVTVEHLVSCRHLRHSPIPNLVGQEYIPQVLGSLIQVVSFEPLVPECYVVRCRPLCSEQPR